MADAWGGAWSDAWGDAWGRSATEAPSDQCDAWGGSWGDAWGASWGLCRTDARSGAAGAGQQRRLRDAVQRQALARVVADNLAELARAGREGADSGRTDEIRARQAREFEGRQAEAFADLMSDDEALVIILLLAS